SGIAHFLEHLMFKGTAKHPTGQFSQKIAAVGGQENAFTSYDYTGYFQRVSRENLGAMMDFEADRMTGLVLGEDVIASERNVILEERNQRIDKHASAPPRDVPSCRSPPSASTTIRPRAFPSRGRPRSI